MFLAFTVASAAALLSACGGGNGGATTTPLSAIVIDGAIHKALVCLDKNANGACELDEPQGRTDVAGKVIEKALA